MVHPGFSTGWGLLWLLSWQPHTPVIPSTQHPWTAACFLAVPGTEPRAPCMLSKCSTTTPSPRILFSMIHFILISVRFLNHNGLVTAPTPRTSKEFFCLDEQNHMDFRKKCSKLQCK